MSWSPQQDAALKAVAEWLRRGDRPVFRLFGYAGTGKTTLAKAHRRRRRRRRGLRRLYRQGRPRLRSKGCEGASTIHSLIYRSREGDENGPQFVLNRSSSAAKAALIVIDECSMVDEELGRDLLLRPSRPGPGRPAQLPPVKGGGFFTEAESDVMLTEVHRQAKGTRSCTCRCRCARADGWRRGLRREPRPPPARSWRRPSRRPTRCSSGSTGRAVSTIPASAN